MLFKHYQNWIIGSVMLYLLGGPMTSAQTVQQTVSQFYPQRLIDAANNAQLGSSYDQLSCYAVYDSFANASPRTIIAGYSNGVRADVLVLQAGSPNQFQQIYEVADLPLTGTDCEVQLIDLNGDGSNEVVASFSSLRGNSIDWIFTWDGKKLTNIGPTTTDPKGRIISAAMNSDFVDLYHNGTLQIVSVGEYPPPLDGSSPDTADTLYQLVNGRFQALPNPVLFQNSVSQDSNTPQSLEFSFAKPTLVPGPYTLRVVNGDRFGQNRVTSAAITLNGQVLLPPSAVNQSTEFVKVAAQLQDQNTVHVDLTGPQGSTLLLEIEGQPSGDVNSDGVVNCLDLQIVKNSLGKRQGQTGFDARADVNQDGIVDVRDLSIVASQLPAGTHCSSQ